MEKVHPIGNREQRLYTIFARRLENGLVVVRDIAERKQAEQALRESEEKYRLLVENANEVITVVQDGQLKFVNARATEVTGYLKEELLFKPFTEFIHLADRHMVTEKHFRKLQGERAPEVYPFRIIDKDGNIKWLEMNAVVFTWEGRPAILNFLSDITECKQIQEQLITDDRLATIGRLAAGVAHELNNPLTVVIGYCELLLSKEIPLGIRNELEKIHHAAQRTTKVVGNLLNLVRQQRPEKRYTNINEILHQTLELQAYELRANNIQVFTNFAPNLQPTVVDPCQVQEVFLNIIVNAEEMMSEAHSGGKLIIETKEEEDHIKISFTDDGPGIPEEEFSRIFDPFFTRKEGDKGVGLGLSICHSIVTQHGGRIYAQSGKKKGATFVVQLPITSEEKHEEASIKEEPPHKELAYKILVIDDEADICDIIGSTLSKDGHRVEVASNGTLALRKLAKTNYDLCLVDIKMSQMDGRTFYQKIKRNYPYLTKRVAFITGDTVSNSTQTFLDSTRCPYLAKPFKLNELRSLISNVSQAAKCLEKRHGRKEDSDEHSTVSID